MENTKFYLKITGTLLLSLSAASILTTGIEYKGLIAAVTGLSALLLIRSAEKTSLKQGRTDRMKVALATVNPLYELILILGLITLPIITKEVTGLLLASVALTEILRLETQQKLIQKFRNEIAREGRVITLTATLIAYTFNPYFVFYGAVFIALMALYDSLKLIQRINREI